jgi:hypothetical protein
MVSISMDIPLHRDPPVGFMQELPEIRAIYRKVLLFHTAHIVYLKLILQDDPLRMTAC